MLSSVFGVDGGLEDGGNAAEVLKKSEARRRVLYCIVDDVVDDVDVVIVLGMKARLAGGRLLCCVEVVMGTRLTGGRYVCSMYVCMCVCLVTNIMYVCMYVCM